MWPCCNMPQITTYMLQYSIFHGVLKACMAKHSCNWTSFAMNLNVSWLDRATLPIQGNHFCYTLLFALNSANTNPISCCNLDDQLNSVFHEEPSISSHYQDALLPLSMVNGGNDTLDKILRIMLVLLEYSHPLSQTAGSGFLVGVRFGLNNRNFHHVAAAVSVCHSLSGCPEGCVCCVFTT